MRRLLALLLMLLSAPAMAQTVVSEGPDAVSVTIYRDPQRADGGAIDLDFLRGFALVTETRRIRVPRGPATIRFEGVAEGIVPVSAIVTGLPGGTVQRNRDARLLSPAALVDGSLGNRVHLRRTNPEDGRVREEEAVIRAGPNGGVVFETARGIEALRCSGFPETLIHDDVPAGLSAKPTLSVDTISPESGTAVVTLSYLAHGFDWTAHYVAEIGEDGESMDMLAWLTLANSNGQSFADADLQAVAGTLNRERAADIADVYQQLALEIECWPYDSTHTYPRWELDRYPVPPPPPLPAAPGEAIVVTGTRTLRADLESVSPLTVVGAEALQEDLGDLKLYRFPEPVTVAANAQKQVALVVRPDVQFERVYTGAAFVRRQSSESTPLILTLRSENIESEGLGVPLPAGVVTVFERAVGRLLPVAETALADRAIGEEIDIATVQSPQVQLRQRGLESDAGETELIVSNANPHPVSVEVAIGGADDRLEASGSGEIVSRDGRRLWTVEVPANDERSLRVRR